MKAPDYYQVGWPEFVRHVRPSYSRVSNKRTYVRKGILTNCPLCMGLLDSLYDALRVKIFLRNNTNVGKY